jgi:hypothetical protein
VAADDCGNILEVFTQVITIQDTTATWSTAATALNTTVECSNAEALLQLNSLLLLIYDATKYAKVSGL